MLPSSNKGNLFRVSKIGIRLILYHAFFTTNKSAQTDRAEDQPCLICGFFLITGMPFSSASPSATSALFPLENRLFRGQYLQLQRAFNRNFVIAKGFIREDFGLLSFSGISQSSRQFAGSALQRTRSFSCRGFCEAARTSRWRQLAEPCLFALNFTVRQKPDIGGNAGVVKHVFRQGDNCFQPVVFNNPADIAFSPVRHLR